jgi:phenylacetate-coenzyme A ligase PaaK-like adenylate-forming protein
MHVDADNVDDIRKIPFLPISFFKSHTVLCAPYTTTDTTLVFESSGTTGENNSKHYVADEAVYQKSLLLGFANVYGAPSQYAILALLPSYLERKNASLVYMANELMNASGNKNNGFYINEWEKLNSRLLSLQASGIKTLLIGVTFALLDFAEAYPMALTNTIVMETGGMKGRKKEMTRQEVHNLLKKQWELDAVHSEYGMTELLSQAYAVKDGIYTPSATMKVMVREMNDPLDVAESGNGLLNVIDLANIHSCSFIATDDIATVYSDGTFEVLGRADHTALRGCSLMAV